ncbi:hypothetical protein EYF80_021884 [Liparis tanakae]|uniref:Uncharacterized protein n=1 Tax=Liparis tanakae TaxID=230148 RepID=A0A4Z2HRH3_9TELE|nr:hypothetical protein EYF80_021884 [Liparis tanakae]
MTDDKSVPPKFLVFFTEFHVELCGNGDAMAEKQKESQAARLFVQKNACGCSFWALVIPYFSSRVRRSPRPSSPQDTSERLREGWWVACLGTEGRMEAAERKRLVNKPRPP